MVPCSDICIIHRGYDKPFVRSFLRILPGDPAEGNRQLAIDV